MNSNAIFHVFAVIMYTNGMYAVYDVVTNAGVSRFVPAVNIPLPKLVLDFMLNNYEKRVQLGTCTCFYGNEVA